LRRKDCSSYISCVTQHADRGANIEDSRCSLETICNQDHFYQQTTSSWSCCKNIAIRNCTETIGLPYFTYNKLSACHTSLTTNKHPVEESTLLGHRTLQSVDQKYDANIFKEHSVFKISVTSHQFNSPEDLNLHEQQCQNLQPCKYSTIYTKESYPCINIKLPKISI
jgi:hypothetical protein